MIFAFTKFFLFIFDVNFKKHRKTSNWGKKLTTLEKPPNLQVGVNKIWWISKNPKNLELGYILFQISSKNLEFEVKLQETSIYLEIPRTLLQITSKYFEFEVKLQKISIYLEIPRILPRHFFLGYYRKIIQWNLCLYYDSNGTLLIQAKVFV
jgi:hypothetical protein